jgi:hypothetical protein
VDTLKNIEMMNQLMIRSSEILEEQKKESRLSRDNMVVQARQKIKEYFEEVLRVLPFRMINVTINSIDIAFLLRKGDKTDKQLNDFSTDLSNGGFDMAIISFKNSQYSSHYVAVEDKFSGKKWGSTKTKKLEDNEVIELAKNFDLIKRKVEEAIATRINKEIDDNARKLKKESEELDALSNFLN